MLSFVHPPGVTLSGVSGTIWKGRAQAVRSGTLHVGSVEWDLDILPLFTGKLGADVKVTRSDGFAQGIDRRCAEPRITLRGLNASLPVSALPPNVVRGGWTGTMNLKLGAIGARELLAGRGDGHDRSHGSGRPGQPSGCARQLQGRLPAKAPPQPTG